MPAVLRLPQRNHKGAGLSLVRSVSALRIQQLRRSRGADSIAGVRILGQNRMVSEPTLDETNRAIIRLLQRDGRRAYADVAKEVGLSEAAVRQRVRRLLDSGVIQIVAVTDQLQMGFPRAAMVAINVDGDVQSAASAIGAIDEVDYLVSTAGGIDLLAEVFASDDQHLFSLLNRIRAIDGVRHAQTYMYFKIHKQTYQWGAE